MTIKSSGNQLSFSEIEAEFGDNPGRSLGQYRRDDPSGNFDNASPSGSSLSNLPLDTGVPTSGEIKFSDFYGKQLNMIVDYFADTGSANGEANNILNRQDDGANTMERLGDTIINQIGSKLLVVLGVDQQEIYQIMH